MDELSQFFFFSFYIHIVYLEIIIFLTSKYIIQLCIKSSNTFFHLNLHFFQLLPSFGIMYAQIYGNISSSFCHHILVCKTLISNFSRRTRFLLCLTIMLFLIFFVVSLNLFYWKILYENVNWNLPNFNKSNFSIIFIVNIL